MRHWNSTLLLVLLCHLSLAQQLPHLNQTLFNPYAFNPAYLGDQGYIEASLTHRRQWMGVDGAPTTTWFTLQIPTQRRLAVGLNLTDDRYGPLAATQALVTASYSVPFSEVTYLRFGLSAGVGMHRVDLSKIDDPDDPLVSTALPQRNYLDGGFGMFFRHANFTAGVTLPRLLGHRLVSDESLEVMPVSEFRQMVAQMGYDIKFPLSDWALHPQVFYRIHDQIQQVEGQLVGSYKKLVWAGGAYRQSNTWAGLAGVRLYQRARLGYSYELPGSARAFGATHEVTLHWQFGKKRSVNQPRVRETQPEPLPQAQSAPNVQPSDSSPEPTSPMEVNSPVVEPFASEESVQDEPIMQKPTSEETTVEEVIQTEPIEDEPVPAKPVQAAPVTYATASDQPNSLSPGMYVVVGAFRKEQNAQKWQAQLSEKEYTSQYGYLSTTRYYYVYTQKFDSLDTALQQSQKLRATELLYDTWVLVVKR